MRLLQNRAVRTPGEIEKLVLFAKKVEETRLVIEAEEEGEDVSSSCLRTRSTNADLPFSPLAPG